MSTARTTSPDSGEVWTSPGAWPTAPGVHRIPLPLPNDALQAVNVYAVEADDGLVLIDGGWAIPEARVALARGLAKMDASLSDVRRILVTHAHRDHYSLARALGDEYGIQVALGTGDRPAIEQARTPGGVESHLRRALVGAGAPELAERWAATPSDDTGEPSIWAEADQWLDGEEHLDLGTRALTAVHTPGHTPGHFVFADAAAGLLFSGDHVLPTITPSIGFVFPTPDQPLHDFLQSMARVRALPDLTVLPAHGPIAPSSHARADELVEHHEQRLSQCRQMVTESGAATARAVAGELAWTRHRRAFIDLDLFSQILAALETKAHLDLLVARGSLARSVPSNQADVYMVTT